MKKIPTLFVREFLNQHDFILTEKVTPGMEWVLKGEGVATIKIDGSATAIIEGVSTSVMTLKEGKLRRWVPSLAASLTPSRAIGPIGLKSTL